MIALLAWQFKIDVRPAAHTTAHTRAHDGNEYHHAIRDLGIFRHRIIEPIPFDRVLRDIEAPGGGDDVRWRAQGIAGGIGLLRVVYIPVRTMGWRWRRNVLEREQIGQPRGGIVRDHAIHTRHLWHIEDEDNGRGGGTLRVKLNDWRIESIYDINPPTMLGQCNVLLIFGVCAMMRML